MAKEEFLKELDTDPDARKMLQKFQAKSKYLKIYLMTRAACVCLAKKTSTCTPLSSAAASVLSLIVN